jgi:hypothetical protein
VEKKTRSNYESPELKIMEIEPEGFLCDSNEVIDENEGYW